MRTVQKRYRDPQRCIPVGKCCQCGGELYPGETYWRVWGHTLCVDCAGPWLAVHPAHAGEVRL